MNKPFFSIIIPVYNIEKYLNKCLKSILNQSYKDYEVIIIDDCSNDNSFKIGSYFSQIDSRFKFFSNSKNLGLSETRNKGLTLSNSKFIIFLDGDDYIDETSLDRIFQKIYENQNILIDVIACNLVKVKNNYFIPQINTPFLNPINGEEFLRLQLSNKTFFVSACRYVYNREFIFNRFFFMANIYHEDELWTPIVISNAKNIIHLPGNFYYHFLRDYSITTDKMKLKKRLLDSVKIMYIMTSYSFDNLSLFTISLIHKKMFDLFLFLLYKNALFNYYDKNDYSHLLKFIKNSQKVLYFFYKFNSKIFVIIYFFRTRVINFSFLKKTY
jgi:glycosyltransferase involved in cell wall biosynthesis